MSDAQYVSAVGLQVQQKALDAIANNIANINTAGFKRSEVRFADIVAGGPDPTLLPADLSAVSPTLAGVALDVQFMLNEQGALDKTGGAMDLAIDGPGFIELMGPDGRTLLWRGGGLTVNEQGQLTGPGGYLLKAGLTLPTEATGITIASDGLVSATGAEGASPVELGRIHLVQVANPSDIERLDGGLYRLAETAQPNDAVPGEDGAGMIVQGSVERSTVRLTDEMVRMMLVQRAYAANAQLLQAADQMMGIANGLRR